MKSGLWIGVGATVLLAVFIMAVLGLGLGWAVWGRGVWAGGMMTGSGGMMGHMRPGFGPGWGLGTWQDPRTGGDPLTIQEATEAVEAYLAATGYRALEIAEVMEFERNFYAIAREYDTGIGAMELLVDKQTGAVGPEMGPNMMWNARYGMHRGGMMGRNRETNVLSPAEVLQIAQRWLDAYRPGVVVEEHADPFYGYYTIHTMRDGEIEGMLSVHGNTGQVWYHTWHGAFIQMIELEEDH